MYLKKPFIKLGIQLMISLNKDWKFLGAETLIPDDKSDLELR